MPYSVRVRVRFSAAHYLENYQGKCEKVHGHNYVVEVWVQSQRVKKNGLTYDFTELKNDIKKILPDHQLLNEVFDFNPTAENLAKYFYKELKKWYPVKKVVVWETEDSAAEYEP
ncbi:MAG: 6-carboxytetrahydropterin synthase QueD [candidate division WOR-3 bacterium]